MYIFNPSQWSITVLVNDPTRMGHSVFHRGSALFDEILQHSDLLTRENRIELGEDAPAAPVMSFSKPVMSQS